VSLVAVVLAAGSASRFGADKLMARFRGEPLLAHAIRAARAAPVARVIVIAGPKVEVGEWPEEWPGGAPVGVVRIASAALSDSLKAGIAAAEAEDDCEGAFVFLGDMPLVPHGAAQALADALGANYAAVVRHQGQQGHPVLLARRAFADVMALTGDAGAGKLLKARADVATLDWPEPGVRIDIDRREDLARIERGEGLPG